MYLGDEAVTIGSSNFTEPGLVRQLEANARFTRAGEAIRFAEAQLIAENYWSAGTPYTADLVKLLEGLLRWVTWQEALARARYCRVARRTVGQGVCRGGSLAG